MASGPNTAPTELLKAASSVFYHLDREAAERDQKKEKYEDRRQAQLLAALQSDSQLPIAPERPPHLPHVLPLWEARTQGLPGERAVSLLQ